MKTARSGGRNRVGCAILGLKFVVLPGLLLYMFRFELDLVWRLYRFVVLEDQSVFLPPTREWSFQIIFFVGGVLVSLAAGLVMLHVISGSIYPLSFSHDRFATIQRLVNFFAGIKSPVVWVREGRQVLGTPGAKDYSGGVVLVDPNSAVVLEDARKTGPRVRSGGVVFIGSKEKLIGSVSLRRQSRNIYPVKVQTSDGIELTTNVSVNFTLGEEPEVKKVAYVGNLPFSHEQKHLDLRVIKIKWDSPDGGNIEAISDELDEADRQEIHRYIKEFRRQASNRTVPLVPDDDNRMCPPYFVDDQLIQKAARAQARRANNEGAEQWADFPATAATEKLRNLIAAYRYDQLYLPKEFNVFASVGKMPAEFPLAKYIRPAFANQVKGLGVLSYQYLFPITGLPLEVNLRVDRSNFRMAPVQSLTNSKILRNLGIKVKSASFGDLKPSQDISSKRVEHWAALWQEVTEHEVARGRARAERIKAEARSRRYVEMLRRMYDILDGKNKSTDDVLVASILQTLKEIADDPDTRRGLPDETVVLMKTLQSRLLPPGKP